MAFVARDTENKAPYVTDKWWVREENGGYNSCKLIDSSTGSVLPNCVGYAWGRFGEILGSTPRLSCGDAGTWYLYRADGYSRGDTMQSGPQLGAVLCFSSTAGGAGHVAIVERINSDGSILTSESGYKAEGVQYDRDKHFWVATRTPPTYVRSGEKYEFQGFIYNPAVTSGVQGNLLSPFSMQGYIEDRLGEFIEIAQEHVGENNSWTCETTGLSKNNAWSAAFIVACAKSVNGLINTIIPNTYSCTAIGRLGDMRGMGTWYPGPQQSGTVQWEIGDIVLFRNPSGRPKVKYQADGAGIVVAVENNSMQVVKGDDCGKVSIQHYNFNTGTITACYRPDWSKVEGTQSVTYNRYTPKGLYTSSVSMNDASVKEIGYMQGYQPSINRSPVKLSLINYTGLLGGLYSVFGGVLTTADASNTSDQAANCFDIIGSNVLTATSSDTSVAATCYNIILSWGLNSAAACGILGNIEAECGFNAGAQGDKEKGVYTSFGLCQWHNDRGAQMKAYCGSNWDTDVSGQMSYLKSELDTTYYSGVLNGKGNLVGLRSVPNTEAGAATAADTFVRIFEVPANVDKVSTVRQANARKWFSQLVLQK